VQHVHTVKVSNHVETGEDVAYYLEFSVMSNLCRMCVIMQLVKTFDWVVQVTNVTNPD